jgi:hypothetical protein
MILYSRDAFFGGLNDGPRNGSYAEKKGGKQLTRSAPSSGSALISPWAL